MRKILVLGGNGFIGKNLCEYFASKGEDVYSFGTNVPAIKNSKVNYISGDFFDSTLLEDLIKDKDVVFHCICSLNPGNSESKYILGYEKDFIQTIKLCCLIKKYNIKMIYLSSGGTVYGKQLVQPVKENALPIPINHYGNLKLCIESTIRTFNTQMDNKMIVVRISNPYGPGQDFTKGVGFIDAALKNGFNNSTLNVFGDGSIIRDYIYIDDVSKMLYSLIDYLGDEEVFNISTGIGTSQNEVIDIVKKLFPQLSVNYVDSRAVDVNKMVLDNGKILKVSDIKITSIIDGISKYFEYIKG